MPDAHAELLDLWLTYRNGEDLPTRFHARQALLVRMLEIVRSAIYASSSRLPTCSTNADHIHEAITSRLIKDLDRYDPARGVPLPNYIRSRTRYFIRQSHGSRFRPLLESQMARDDPDSPSPTAAAPAPLHDPCDHAARNEFWSAAAGVLNPREVKVLRLAYLESQSIDAISFGMKYARTTVSDIHASALAKIRNSPRLLAMLEELIRSTKSSPAGRTGIHSGAASPPAARRTIG
jgi:RNA polymerase sigma factor (sigma-70 family)